MLPPSSPLTPPFPPSPPPESLRAGPAGSRREGGAAGGAPSGGRIRAAAQRLRGSPVGREGEGGAGTTFCRPRGKGGGRPLVGGGGSYRDGSG